MLIKKNQWPILIVNMAIIISFAIYYLMRNNLEFLIYIGVIVFFLILIIITNEKVNYPNGILWGLTFWAFLHMAGGSLDIKGLRLYEVMIIPITENIFRFDQFVHIVGFTVATLVIYHLLKPLLKTNPKWTTLSIVIIMAGLGLGALNEIVEFIATVIAPKTGVGGYLNTSLDLISDLIGALIGMIIIRIKEIKK